MKYATITFRLSYEDISDLLTSALEGGSIYWIDFVKWSKGVTHIEGLEKIMDRRAFFLISDDEGEMDKPKKITYKELQNGLGIMAKDYPSNFADILNGNQDGSTADVFLQCAVFGKVIFG